MIGRRVVVILIVLVGTSLWLRQDVPPPSHDVTPDPPPAIAQPPAPEIPRPEPVVADYGDMRERMAVAKARVERRLDYFHTQPWYLEATR